MTLFSSMPLFAATYYVDPSKGSDTNNGAKATPWKTLAKANVSLKAGDILYLRGGEYDGGIIQPANSGASGSEIVYMAYPGETPVLTNAKASKGTSIVLDGRKYIIVDGISIDGKKPFRDSNIKAWGSMQGTQYSVIQNCSFIYAEGWNGFTLDNGAYYNKILNNKFENCGAWIREDGFDHGDALVLGCAEHNLVEGNTFIKAGHNLIVVYGNFNVVRNNFFDNYWGTDANGQPYGNRCLELTDSNGKGCYSSGHGYNLFENNTVTNCYRAADNDYPVGIKVQGVNQIVRFNYLYNSAQEMISSIASSGFPTCAKNKIYNNSIANAGGPGWMVLDYGSGEVVDKNVFVNNIIYMSHTAPKNSGFNSEVYVNMTARKLTVAGNSATNNCLYSQDLAKIFVAGLGSYSPASSSISETFKGNFSTNPMLASSKVAKKEDMYLKPTSPLIDAAKFFCFANGSGSGKVIKVTDAGYFTDGFGIVDGDMLQVAKNSPVRITKVDYANNTITLATGISWKDGDNISLPYYGNYPDVGAYEYNPGGTDGGQVTPRTIYFIDPNIGNDGNDGSQNKPWKTIAKANASLIAGDTAYLRTGEYNGQVIRPATSGQAGKQIYYMAYPGEYPVLTNAKAVDGTAINLDDRSYIYVQGVYVDGKSAGTASSVSRWVSMNNSSYNTLKDCDFKYAGGTEGILLDGGSKNNQLLNNIIDYCGVWKDASGKPSGISISLQCAKYNTIEGNKVRRGGDALLFIADQFNVIRNNTFDNSWGTNTSGEKIGSNGVILTNKTGATCDNGIGGNNLFEGNVVQNTWKRSDGKSGVALKIEGENQVVRQNYIFNAAAGITSLADQNTLISRYNRVYHNTVVSKDGWSIQQTLTGEDSRFNVFKNNIAVTIEGVNGHVYLNLLADGNGLLNSNQLINNCFFNPVTSPAEELDIEGDGKNTVGYFETTYRQDIFDNWARNPKFLYATMATTEDLKLEFYSPMVDAGAHLTYTVSSGSGTVVPVADARYFTNGYGITAGDQVQIGANAVVKVTKVDYAANKITVDKSVSWSANTPVSLTFKGTGPDVGAFESDILTANRDTDRGTSVISVSNELVVYPNPSNGQINVQWGNAAGNAIRMDLMTVDGKVLHTEHWEGSGVNNKDLDFSTFPKGIYLLRLSTDKDGNVRKIILE